MPLPRPSALCSGESHLIFSPVADIIWKNPWRRIEVVITGLTRNQFAGNRTWVRIPPSPPNNLPQVDTMGINSGRPFYLNFYLGTGRFAKLCNAKCKARHNILWCACVSENRNHYILWSAIVKLLQFVKRLKTIYIIVCETASHSESHYLLRVYDTILKKGAERINNDSRKGCDVVK